MPQKPGKGDAHRKVKALLHTFVAGQKYGVGWDATRRFCFLRFYGLKNVDTIRIKYCIPVVHLLSHPTHNHSLHKPASKIGKGLNPLRGV